MARRNKSFLQQLQDRTMSIGRSIAAARDALRADVELAVGGKKFQDKNQFLKAYKELSSIQKSENVLDREAEDGVAPVTRMRQTFLKNTVVRKGYKTLNGRSLPSSTHVGKLLMYVYDAKYKDVLPYYDAFPLIFHIKPLPNGNFMGLNLHYAPPKARALLMDSIVDKVMKDPSKRQGITFDQLQKAAKNKIFESCIKQYIPGRVMTNAVEIPEEAWATYMFLPLADWRSPAGGTAKGLRKKVYRDSQKRF